MKNHVCSLVEKCIHCSLNHKSNSLKCSVVKSFRADLTRKLLHHSIYPHNNSHVNPTIESSNTITNNSKNLIYDISNFPTLRAPHSSTNNQMMEKLDNLVIKLSEVKDHLAALSSKNEKFEQFIIEKNQSDQSIQNNISYLSQTSLDLKKEVNHYCLLTDRHDKLFLKLLFPMFDELFNVITNQNKDKNGNSLDADLKQKLERYRILMRKSTDGKHFVF